MIDPDTEAQEGIDAEEAAAAEFADDNTDPAATAENEEDGSMELLEELEKVDRQIVATEDEKKDTAQEFNQKLKDLRALRGAALENLDAYRRGERSLFDGDGD